MALIDKTSIGTGNTIQAEHITRIIDALNESGSYEIIATGSFTGSFVGDASGLTGITSVATASYAHYAVSASYEINYETSSSYADFAKTASYITLPQVLTADNATSGNNIIMTEGDDIIFKYSGFNNNINTNPLTSNRNILFPDASGTVALTTDTLATSSYALTASYVETAQSASYITAANVDGTVATATSASYSLTASYIETAQTASYIETAQTASYIETAQTASYVLGSNISGAVALATTASYSITANTLSNITRTVYTLQTTDGLPLNGPAWPLPIDSTRYIKAIVQGWDSSNGTGLAGEFTNLYSTDFVTNTLLNATGTLYDNMSGTPAFSLGVDRFTVTGIAGATINWRVIIERTDY